MDNLPNLRRRVETLERATPEVDGLSVAELTSASHVARTIAALSEQYSPEADPHDPELVAAAQTLTDIADQFEERT